MDLNQGNILIHVMEDYAQMSKKAAAYIKALVDNNHDCVLGLATGSTPIGLYQELIAFYKEGVIDFSNVKTFNLDEYYPIQKTNAQSYDYFMKENLFHATNFNPANIHIPNGEATDINRACVEYEAALSAAGWVDIQVLGMGLNGHIGFNEPDAALNAATSVVQLEDSTIDANARFFANREAVPKQAISMGMKSIMMAKKILLLVNGAKKAQTVHAALTGKITTAIPASLLQLHRDVVVVMDKEAGVYFTNQS